MGNKIINGYKFIGFEDEKFHIYFSTAEKNLNFNKNTSEGISNLENLRIWFGLDSIGYLNQTHSDIVYAYDEEVHDGDAIITDKKNIGIGVFTADCIPILIYDKDKEVIAAIHSGWKGTLKCIVQKAIDKMILKYNTDARDLVVYIGPHNMQCCYEVSDDLIEEFKKQEIYQNINIAKNRNLSLQSCIISQLLEKEVNLEQINPLNICTYCSNEYSLHSYRKDKEESGRMFSFIFIK
ncbi:peptidoglycan editing factor PgeF [Clostridium bovifaecis]|uniref:Purine nucleoside phosphorylase n=1 Tax=Clostridium bovifaecis TaxID=2184719 RepID=A0A6I6EYA5_9CLOT|nr:peptidoglycan editing factor PgeF [Clostridium bovifaecis]